MLLDEGKWYVTCVNGNHVYNEISLWFLVFGQQYRTLSHALTGDISLHASSGRHCLSIIVDIKPRQSILPKKALDTSFSHQFSCSLKF